jgi:hypothetical protein
MAVDCAEVAFATVEAAVAVPVTVDVLERVIGNNDLISVTFLDSAVRVARPLRAFAFRLVSAQSATGPVPS